MTTSWPGSHRGQSALAEKLSGSYYTPPEVADFILKWAFNGRTDYRILEPSCGDGVFLRALARGGYRFASVKGVEIDATEARKAREVSLANSSILHGEFHHYCSATSDRFDLVIGNPPFIRYQFFDEDQRALAERIFKRAGLRYTRLANPWISFLIGSCLLLKETGKIGMVVPAELLQVAYAKEARAFLARFFDKICIVSFQQLIFEDVQQEVVVFLGERTGSQSHRIDHVEVPDSTRLSSLDPAFAKAPRKRLDFRSNKWTFYFLDQEQITFLESMNSRFRDSTLGHLARVEVGITTGMNPFFTVDKSVVQRYSLQRFAVPMVGRSVQIEGAVFTDEEWRSNVDNGARAYLLRFPNLRGLKRYPLAQEYISLGEKLGYSSGYKCGIRDEWQIVPSAWIPPALFLRRNHHFPRFVVNEAKAYTTDTMHRVVPKEGVDLRALVASYYNSLSFASAEVCGRSHGGGVLELMPNEAERVILPYRRENAVLLPRIDAALRDDTPVEELLSFTDEVVLRKGQGLSQPQVDSATRIWERLRARRLGRRHS